jgi:hypothetical protein
MKYVLWRVSNGWLMTYGTTIWEDKDHLAQYAVFHTIKEFSDWVAAQSRPPKPERKSKPQPRIHGKFAAKPTNRVAEHAGRATARH